MTIDIRVAGPLAVEAAGPPHGAPFRLGPGDLPGRQGRLVLAALAVRGEAVDRDDLADLLWPDELPNSWRVDLSAVVSKLRAALRPLRPDGPPIASGRGWYRLELPGPVRVDVVEAERRLVEAEQAGDRIPLDALDEVVAVTRRPFLPGDECLWVDERRAHQRRLHHRALTLRAELLRRAGAAEARAAAEAVVDHEPHDEAGYLLLAVVQIEGGDRAGALATIADLRRRLADDLGLEPSDAVHALEQQALSGAPGHPQPALPPPLAAPAVAIVGRDVDVERVTGLLAGPRPALVLLVGEAGVGKTALAAAAARTAHSTGRAVLFGACHADLGPMAAWSEALRRAARWPLDDERPAAPDDPDRSRAELFDAVGLILEQVDAAVPALVVLDDLHEADRPTLQLIEHLVGEGVAVRVLATARRSELGEPPLRDLRARLRRDDRIELVEVAGLGVDDTSDLVDAVTGSGTSALHPRLVPALHGATAGNPLYIREALRHLVATGNLAGVRDGSPLFGSTASPEGLEALIDANLARLGSPVRHVLEAAAISGPIADVDVVLAAGGVEDGPAALDRAVQAGVLSEAGRHVRFTHPLVREVLVGSLTATRRAALHRAVSDALVHTGGPASRARHVLGGGPPSERSTIGPVRAAGDLAMGAFAYDEAVDWYRDALELAEPAGARPTEVATLLIALGDALNRAGRAGDAVEPLTAAVALARARRDPALLALAVLERAKLLVDEGVEGGQVNGRLVALLEDALGTDPPPPPELRARLRGRLSMELHFAGDLDRCLDICALGEEEARASGDPVALEAVLGARHYALYGSPRVQERLTIAGELADLRHAAVHHAGRPDLRMIRNYLELADVGALRVAVSEFDRRLPRGIASDRYVIEVWRAAEAALEGRLADAEALAQRAVEVGYVSSRGRAAVEAVQGGQVFAVRFFEGRLGELTELLDALATAAPERPIWRAAAALCALQAGDRAGALQRFGRVRGAGFEQLPWSIDRPLTLAMLGWVAAEVGSPADAQSLLELLRPYEELMVVNGAAPSLLGGPATYPLAVLAGRLGRTDEADAWFLAAEATAARWSARPWTALVELDHARSLAAAGRDRSASGRTVDELRHSAAAVAREVGMPHVEERATTGWT